MKFLFMVHKTVLPFSMISALIACSDNSSHSILLKQTDESLLRSNNHLRNATTEVLEALKNKLADPATVEKAKVVQPKIFLIHSHADKLFEYLETLRQHLKEGKGVKDSTLARAGEKLDEFKRTVINADALIAENRKKIFWGFANGGTDSANYGTPQPSETLRKASASEALVDLSRMQNDAAIVEHRAVLLLFQQIRSYFDGYWEFNQAIIAQNAKVLNSGSNLEIMAGVGAFSKKANPIVVIGKDSVQIDERGLAVKTIKTSETPGKYKLPVVVSFTDFDGHLQTRTFTVEYKTVSTLNN